MTIRSQGYNIYTNSALEKLAAFLKKKNYATHYILCDENTLNSCMAILLSRVPALSRAEVIETESGEENKALEVCAGIWQSMAEQHVSRNAVIINLGGGVVCDMGGFCASIYKRGIDFIQVPTTLLAMVDAATGGKTGVNLHHTKNLIGTFRMPSGVFIEEQFLQTLSQRHYYNGLAEVFKTALVCDADLFGYLDRFGGNAKTSKLINRCVRLKNEIVTTDPFDRGRRKILNFGHSLGHALEGHAIEQGFDLLHGEAVVAGMIMESHIAHQKKMLHEKHLISIVSLLLGHYGKLSFEIAAAGLLPFLVNDKKNKGGQFNFSLITEPGKARWDQPVRQAEINKAIGFYNSLQYAEN